MFTQLMEQPNGEQLAITSGFKGAKYKKTRTNSEFFKCKSYSNHNVFLVQSKMVLMERGQGFNY